MLIWWFAFATIQHLNRSVSKRVNWVSTPKICPVSIPGSSHPPINFLSQILLIYIFLESGHRTESENISPPNSRYKIFFFGGKGGPLPHFWKNWGARARMLRKPLQTDWYMFHIKRRFLSRVLPWIRSIPHKRNGGWASRWTVFSEIFFLSS